MAGNDGMKIEPGTDKKARISAVGRRTFAIFAMLTLLPGLLGGSAQPQPRAKNVLVLSSFFIRDSTSIDNMEASVRARAPWPVNFTLDSLENPRLEEEAYRESLAETFHREFEGQRPDLVMVASEPALQFAVEYRDTMFPGTPIVFWAISSALADEKMPGVTGVATPAGIRDTIDLALRLEPDTTSFAVIVNTSPTEKYWLGAVHAELLSHADKVKEIDIVGPPGAEMLEKVGQLPPHTVIMFLQFPQNSNDPPISNWDVLAAASRRLPTYSIFPTLALNRGGIGGAYYDATKDSVLAGELGARVLRGERPDDIPVVHNSLLQTTVDWRQLQRWHIAESALPPGSIVLYRQPNLWQQYKGYVVAALSLILLETGLIMALIGQWVRRRRSERELSLTYDRLRLAVEAARNVGWDADFKSGRNLWFGDLELMFGIGGERYDADMADFRRWVHPDDRERVLAALQKARESREPYAAEFRVVRADGVLRWISARGNYYFGADGEPERMLGMAADITERKLAEEALKNLSGRLIHAQEEERRRIAREIHDDHQQRLAVLSIELDSLCQDAGEQDEIMLFRLRELSTQVKAIASDLHSLSHRLHSTALDSMGLVAALKGLCSEFRKYHDLKVSFVAENVPPGIQRETALCLFRIAQEALQNVRKHSQAQIAEVRVVGLEGEIRLSVSDQGQGFDHEHALHNGGIGIRSMQERVRLVDGRFEVHSRPGGGTTIQAWVPAVTVLAQEA
jgi:signal transduction histidine kinase